MTLSLQDMFASLDSGAPQPGPRANAPSNKPRDPFDALFAGAQRAAPAHDTAVRAAPAHAASPRTAPGRADVSAPSRDAAPARTTDTAPTTSSKPVARTASPSDETAPDAAAESAAAPTAPTDRKADADHADTESGDPAITADATVAPALPNFFQVTLLAADLTTATGNASANASTKAVISPVAAPASTTAAAAVPANSLPAAAAPQAGAALERAAQSKETAGGASAALLNIASAATEHSQGLATAIAATTRAADTLPGDTHAHNIDVADPQLTAPRGADAVPPTGAPVPGASEKHTANAPNGASAPNPGDIAIVAAPAPVAGAASAAIPPSKPQQTPAAPQPPVAAVPVPAAAPTAAQSHLAAQTSDTAPKAAARAEAASAKSESKSKDSDPETPAAARVASAAAAQMPAIAVDATPVAVPLADTSAPPATDAGTKSTDTGAGLTAPVMGAGTSPQAHQVYAQAAERAAALPQVTIDQVAMHLTKAAADGIDHLTIHLKPEQLGAIEVKIEMSDRGLAKATISADRADTLDLLQRDSHRLERALENAGIKADAGSLSFNLRDGGSQYLPYSGHDHGGSPSPRSIRAEDSPPTVPAMLGYINARAALGGVDIRV